MAPKKEKKQCPRCKQFEDFALAVHDIHRCKWTTSDIERKWHDFPTGEPCDEPEQDAQVCKAFLEKLKPGATSTLTKYKLEAMFDKAYKRGTGAVAGSSKKAKVNQSAQNTLPLQQKHDAEEAGKAETSSKTEAPLPTWNVQTSGPLPAATLSEPFKLTVYESNVNRCKDLTNAKGRTGHSGTPTHVAANYVSVDKVPTKLYEYSIAYIVKKEDDAGDNEGAHGKAVASSSAHASASENTGPTGSNQPSEVKRRSEKRRVWEALSNDHAPFQHRRDWATDYERLWCLKPLQDDEAEPSDGQIHTIHDVSYTKSSGHTATLDRVEFTFQYILEFGSGPKTAENVAKGPITDRGASACITALNALISKHATTNLPNIISVGPNKFYLQDVSKKMTLLNANRGYFSSVRPGVERVLLNVGTVTGAFFDRMLVSEFMDHLSLPQYREYGFYPRLLTGRSVRLCYDRPQHGHYDPNEERYRYKVIAGFGDPPSQQHFISSDGRDFTVRDYYVNELGASPAPSDRYACVNVGLAKPGREIWIPAQYLEIARDQPFNRKLCPDHMEAMLQTALHTAPETQRLITQEGLHLLGLTRANAATNLAELGLKVDKCLVEIPARFLPIPQIHYREDSRKIPESASWNLRNVQFRRGPPNPLQAGIHNLDFTDSGYNLTGIGNDLTVKLREHGIPCPGSTGHTSLRSMSGLSLEQYPSVNISDYKDAELRDMIKRNVKQRPGLFLVMLADNNSNNYAKKKRVLDQHLGVHNVCLTLSKLLDKQGELKPTDQSLLSNLALKINIKHRGQNHQVSKGLRQPVFSILPADTIVLGADVSHAPSQMSYCPSVAAVVGSDDVDFANFPGSMRLQASGQEIIAELEDMVAERVKRYATSLSKFPRNVLFYRDGVSEGQFKAVRESEIKSVERGVQKARGELNARNKSGEGAPIIMHNEKVQITFLIVTKRHNTRFFCRQEEQSSDVADDRGVRTAQSQLVVQKDRDGNVMRNRDRTEKKVWNHCKNGNVKPGLIVDTVITTPSVDETYDFFLQSHEALQGTAKSGHYYVLQAGKGMDCDKIQTVTHGFCYNYARATKGVSYAGPAYYADRLCDRGTHYLKAYAAGKQDPEWPPTEEEKEDKKMADYKKRVAMEISRTVLWNQNQDARSNPWHKNLDNCMFWL